MFGQSYGLWTGVSARSLLEVQQYMFTYHIDWQFNKFRFIYCTFKPNKYIFLYVISDFAIAWWIILFYIKNLWKHHVIKLILLKISKLSARLTQAIIRDKLQPKSRYYKERQVDRKKRQAIRWWFVSIRHGRHLLSQCPKERHFPIIKRFLIFPGGECLCLGHWLRTWRPWRMLTNHRRIAWRFFDWTFLSL